LQALCNKNYRLEQFENVRNWWPEKHLRETLLQRSEQMQISPRSASTELATLTRIATPAY